MTSYTTNGPGGIVPAAGGGGAAPAPAPGGGPPSIAAGWVKSAKAMIGGKEQWVATKGLGHGCGSDGTTPTTEADCEAANLALKGSPDQKRAVWRAEGIRYRGCDKRCP